jgi:hypothetical protein
VNPFVPTVATRPFSVLIAALCLGCTTVPRSVLMPEGPYGAALKEATRSVSVYHGVDSVMFAYATDETTSFRKARAERLSQVFHVPVETAEIHGGDITEHFPEAHVFFLAVNTNDRNANDLERPASQWAISLETLQGTVQPASILRITAKVAAIQAVYPYVDRFFVTYRVLFRANVGSGPYTLVLAGPLGEGRMKFAGEEFPTAALH